MISQYSFPSRISTEYSKIAYTALGFTGVYITEICIILSLIGVAISNQIAISNLMKDVFIFHLSINQWIIVSGISIFPFMLIKNPSSLSGVSLAGLFCVLLGILCLYFYSNQIVYTTNHIGLPLFPTDNLGFSTFIGVSCYCFGICTFVFPIQNSLLHKNDITIVIKYTLTIISSFYIIYSISIVFLYYHAEDGIKNNILENLPNDSFFAILVRISMSLVINI